MRFLGAVLWLRFCCSRVTVKSMKGNRGFLNRAKSGTRAMPARWRQAIAKGRIEKALPPRALAARRNAGAAAPCGVPLERQIERPRRPRSG